MNAPRKFSASATHPDFATEIEGRIVFQGSVLRFEMESGVVDIQIESLTMELAGKRIAFSNVEQDDWIFYTTDRAILKEPAVTHRNHLRLLARNIGSKIEGRRRLVTTFIFLGAFVMLSLLATQMTRWTIRYVANRVPVAWEEKISRELLAEITTEEDFLDDPQLLARLESLTSLVAKGTGDTCYTLRIYLMDDPIPNAFALPGGYIGINKGLFEVATTPEEVAGVLAHEMAHIYERHGVRGLISSAGPYYVLRLFVSNRGGVLNVISQGSLLLIQQGFSRDHEREADDRAWDYLMRANIDPRGLETFLRRIQEWENKRAGLFQPGDIRAFRSHPPTEERVEHLQAKWRKAKRKSGFMDLSRFGTF